MLSSTMTFVDILTQELEDPLIKETRIASSREKIQKELVTRIFDDFPTLVARQVFDSREGEFRNIFANIVERNYGQTEENFKLFKHGDKTALKQWEEEIIEIACYELLDDQGKIKSDIVRLLEWEDLLDK